MEPITRLPLAPLYQVCYWAALGLLVLAAMGNPVAIITIGILTEKR